jgi:hypothetical protein
MFDVFVFFQISTTCLYSGTMTSAFGFIARKVSAWAGTRNFGFQSVPGFAIVFRSWYRHWPKPRAFIGRTFPL